MRSTRGTVRVPKANAAMACAPPIWKKCVTPSQCGDPEDLGAGVRARDADGFARRPPAPESRSSAAWRAGDSGRRGCRRPWNRAAARSGRACGRRDISTSFSCGQLQCARIRGYWRRRCAPPRANSGSSVLHAPRNSPRHAHRLPSKPSNLRAYSSSAASPSRRTSSRIGATIALGVVQPLRLALRPETALPDS